MKKFFKYFAIFATVLFAASCQKDELSRQSQIIDSPVKQNEFDKWLTEHYLEPYNIDFKYRMERNESDMNYWLVPAEYQKAITMAKLMLYLCLEPYDEVTGSLDFIRTYYPKKIHLVGSAAYRNNGTMLLGTAEGGLKITLYFVNDLQMDPEFLNHYYFKTMHHEFSHILHQTKPYSTDFDMISGSLGNSTDGQNYTYVTDSWNSAWASEEDAQAHGFISMYGSSGTNEDFVELISIYVTHDAAYWNNIIKTASATARQNNYENDGGSIITAKFDIVYNYMLESWNIDLNELRDLIQERQTELDQHDFVTLN